MNEITIKEIKKDLSDIRYYYSRNIGYNEVVKKAEMYNELIKHADPKLFDLYISLYINNHTQESLSEAMCYTRETVNLLNKRLLTYFQKKIIEQKGGEENESL